MPHKDLPTLGPTELEIMRLIWRADRPLVIRDVYEVLCARRALAYTTVQTITERLARKGLLHRIRVRQSGYSGKLFVYTPALTPEAYIGAVTQQLRHQVLEGA